MDQSFSWRHQIFTVRWRGTEFRWSDFPKEAGTSLPLTAAPITTSIPLGIGITAISLFVLFVMVTGSTLESWGGDKTHGPLFLLWITILSVLIPLIVGWSDNYRKLASLAFYLWGHTAVLTGVLETAVEGADLELLVPLFWAGYMIVTISLWSHLPTLQKSWNDYPMPFIREAAKHESSFKSESRWFLAASIITGLIAMSVSMTVIWVNPDAANRAPAL